MEVNTVLTLGEVQTGLGLFYDSLSAFLSTFNKWAYERGRERQRQTEREKERQQRTHGGDVRETPTGGKSSKLLKIGRANV